MPKQVDLMPLVIVFTLSYLGGFFWAYNEKGLLQVDLNALSGRVIRDLHTALTETITTAAIVYGALLFGGYFLHFVFDQKYLKFLVIAVPPLMIGYLTVHFINTWRSYNFGILIDASRDLVDIPASDVENSLMELLTLKQFFSHGERESLTLSEIERVDNYTSRKSGRKFYITLSGKFGSRQLAFASKQKRDETRNALFAEFRTATGHTLNGDLNIDY